MQTRVFSVRSRPAGWGIWHAHLLLAFILAVVALAACTSDGDGSDAAGDPGEDDEAVSVVVSMPFMATMVEAVGGAHVDVDSIVPPGSDAHTYQPSPGDARTVSEADLIVVNGVGLESFLEGLIESAGGVEVPVIELAAGLEDEGIEAEGHAHEDDEDTAEDDHASTNPHLWLNPDYGIHYVERIAEALIDADPENERDYRANADEYIDDIEEFDQWAKEQIAGIPEENRVMVTFHDAFPYFADHFGLKIAGVVVTSPGREPGAQEVARLADEIRGAGVPAVFVEPQFNPDLAETIADEAGVTTHVIYSDTPPEDVGYLEMLRLNVERVVEGLS